MVARQRALRGLWLPIGPLTCEAPSSLSSHEADAHACALCVSTYAYGLERAVSVVLVVAAGRSEALTFFFWTGRGAPQHDDWRGVLCSTPWTGEEGGGAVAAPGGRAFSLVFVLALSWHLWRARCVSRPFSPAATGGKRLLGRPPARSMGGGLTLRDQGTRLRPSWDQGLGSSDKSASPSEGSQLARRQGVPTGSSRSQRGPASRAKKRAGRLAGQSAATVAKLLRKV